MQVRIGVPTMGLAEYSIEKTFLRLSQRDITYGHERLPIYNRRLCLQTRL